MSLSTMIGAKIHRREDPHLITGGGRFIEDLVRPGTLTMAIVRSPHPHARITRINAESAKAMGGVVAVLTAADFKAVLAQHLVLVAELVRGAGHVPHVGVARHDASHSSAPE